MDVVVFTKFVPDPQGTPRLGPEHLLVRGPDGALDPGDEYGLELALQLVEAEGEAGHVTVVSMGPDEAVTAVQRALAMGAHEGVLISDPALRGADALGTARVLAAAVARRRWDLVIGGVESTDGYTGTVPATVAELLGASGISAVRKLERTTEGIRVERQVEAGYDVLVCALPAVVTVTAGANDPRYPSLKGIMQAKQKPLERLGLADLGLSTEDVAATQVVAAVTDTPAKAGGEVIAAGDDAVARIADLLAEAKAI